VKVAFLTQKIQSSSSSFNSNVLSSFKYLSPKLRESVIESMQTGLPPYTLFHNKSKSDVFSLGLVIIQLCLAIDVQGLNGRNNEKERIKKIYECSFKRNCDFPHILEKMIREDESTRVDFLDLKNLLENHFKDSEN